MSELAINHVIVHELIKEANDTAKSPDLRESTLDKSNAIVQKMVDKMVSLYGTKNNTAQYGIFDTAPGKIFPEGFREYYNSDNGNEDGFIFLTKKTMTSLCDACTNINFATGGYILFIDYENSQNTRFLLIAMIKQKDAVAIKNLEPEALLQLDMDKIHQAARINFKKYMEYQEADAEVQEELTYLGFVAPTATQEVAGYFTTALGCQKGSTSKKATTNAIEGCVTFLEKKHVSVTDRRKLRYELADHFITKSGYTIKLSEIVELVRRYLVDNEEMSIDQQVEELVHVLNSEEYMIPTEFVPHRATAKKYKSLKLSSTGWDIQFNRNLVGVEESSEIQFKQSKKQLIFNNLSEEMIKQLTEETSRDEA